MHIIMLRLKCYILSISESTPAVADTADDDDEDASQFDVTVPHPEHLLLVILGRCSTTKLVLVKITVNLFSGIFDVRGTR